MNKTESFDFNKDVPRRSFKYVHQLFALARKTVASLFGRVFSASILMLSAPLLIILLYIIMRYALIMSPSWQQPQSATIGLDCRRFGTDGTQIDDDCIQLVYGPVGVSTLIDDIYHHLLLDERIRATHCIPTNNTKHFASVLHDNQRSVGMAVYITSTANNEVAYTLVSSPSPDITAYSQNGYDEVWISYIIYS